MNRALISAAAAVLIVSSVAGCGSAWTQSHSHNTPVGPYVESPNKIIEFPYNFDNVSRTCVDGDGVYMPFQGKSVFVVASDPACKNAKP